MSLVDSTVATSSPRHGRKEITMYCEMGFQHFNIQVILGLSIKDFNPKDIAVEVYRELDELLAKNPRNLQQHSGTGRQVALVGEGEDDSIDPTLSSTHIKRIKSPLREPTIRCDIRNPDKYVRRWFLGKVIVVPRVPSFGGLAVEATLRRAPTLERIAIDGCRQMTSKYVQLLLARAPHLFEFGYSIQFMNPIEDSDVDDDDESELGEYYEVHVELQPGEDFEYEEYVLGFQEDCLQFSPLTGLVSNLKVMHILSIHCVQPPEV
ncbi:hypothetical protein BGZ80_003348 [Entomortierella chlamydospora]|uniref:Uncharacterized protein n=1 Tax=Entomortierella chlamydospora TaxID=101097 RepID=A0A9P6MNN6_9FUNG|nr:hypothetical protein BGZ80_003348 [Entomortierella chlamydospora]